MIILATVPAHIKVNWINIWMNMGWVDIVFVSAFIFGIFIGLRRGLAKTCPGFFGVVTAQAISVEYSQAIAKFLNTGVKAVPIEIFHILIFGVLAICSVTVIHFLFRFLSVVASVDFKPPFNNTGAALLGGIQFVLLASLISYFLMLFPLPFIQETFTNRSISGPYLVELNQHIHGFFIKWLPSAWRVIK